MRRSENEARSAQALRALRLCSGLPDAIITSLAREVTIVSVPARRALMRQGDPASAVFGVVSGWLKVGVLSAEGQESTLTLLGPGELVGELGVLGAAPRSASVIACTEAVVVRIGAAAMLGALQQSAPLGLALSRLLAQRIADFSSVLREQTSLSAEARVVEKLLFLAERCPVPSTARRGAVIALGLTQQDLAHFAGLSRQRANRVLGELTRAGLLTRQERRWAIPDLEALRAWANASGS